MLSLTLASTIMEVEHSHRVKKLSLKEFIFHFTRHMSKTLPRTRSAAWRQRLPGDGECTGHFLASMADFHIFKLFMISKRIWKVKDDNLTVRVKRRNMIKMCLADL